jgi:hypothetical protein
VCAVHCGIGAGVSLTYKRLQLPVYIYAVMLFTSLVGMSLVWTVVARERGTTGVREARRRHANLQ